MNRIVRENYPVADLPEDLREGFGDDARVCIVIEAELPPPDRVLSLEELFAMRRPPFKTSEQIVDEVRRMRDDDD